MQHSISNWQSYLLGFSLIFFATIVNSQGFSRLQEEVGLNHLYEPRGHFGGGAVIIDINNDGFMDVYLPGGLGSETLLLNVNGDSLVDISYDAGLWVIDNYVTIGGVAGDVNNDGFEDLFITTWQMAETFGGPNMNMANVLMLNNGDNTFSNSGGFVGIDDAAFSASATLLDINHDGFLDIYVANYVEQTSLIYDQSGQVSGFAHDCFDNYLYINNEGFNFEELAEEYGVNDNGCGLAVVSTDYNRDGDADLMVVNDFGQWISPNKLYENSPTGFEDVSTTTGTDVGIYGMGVAIGDYDEDGDMDYYMTNMGRNVLLRHMQDQPWLDVTTGAGVENTYQGEVLATGWSTFFFDYDNDADVDLYVSNGRIPSAPFIANALYDPNKLYRNNQNGTFTDITQTVNLLDTAVGRGAVIVDFNNDGLLDILQVNIYDLGSQAPNGTVLYLNESDNDHGFVMFALKGVTANPHGIGARVELHAGGRTFVREVDGGSGHASHNDKRVHFGLGQIPTIDSVAIYWPGNPWPQIIHEPAINEIHEVIQENVITDIHDDAAFVTRVFPNPSNGSLSIEIHPSIKGSLRIEIAGVSGKTLFEQNLEASSGLIRLNEWAQQLSAGIYILTISDGTRSETKRIAITE